MAIPPSKLSDFIGRTRLAAHILRKLRDEGLLSKWAPDFLVLWRIKRALREEAREIRKEGFTWASAETRIPGHLGGLLSAKGREWAVSYIRQDRYTPEADVDPHNRS